MSVQKITGLTQQKKSLKSSNATKNGFLSGISFKGYTKEITMHNGSRPYSYRDYGTSGTLREYPGTYATVKAYNIEHPENTSVKEGKKGYSHQSYEYATVDVYYADPNEKITEKIRNNHAYIVEYDKIPKIISVEQIEDSKKTSELKSFVESLERREEVIKNLIHTTEDEIEEAQDYLEATKKAHQEAQKKYDAKVQEKIEQEMELQENTQRLELAKTKYAKVKKAEEEAYIAAETVKVLEETKEKLNSLNGNNGKVAGILAQIERFLGGSKGEN